MNTDILNAIKSYRFFKQDVDLKYNLLDNQGLCNTTYLITTKRGKYIVKKFNNSFYTSKAKRDEFQIQLLAYKRDIAPKPILLDIKNQIFISFYQEGYHKKDINRSDLRLLVKTLKTLHSIKLHRKAFDMKNYFKKHSKKIDGKLKLTLLQLDRFKKDLVLCHNDLNQKNIIFSEKVKFIDWEFTSINDRYFDLASIIIEFNFNKKDEKLFLNLYFKAKNFEKEKLKIYKIIYKHICKIWFDIISKKG